MVITIAAVAKDNTRHISLFSFFPCCTVRLDNVTIVIMEEDVIIHEGYRKVGTVCWNIVESPGVNPHQPCFA